jgi:cytoskeleton protein RodZ
MERFCDELRWEREQRNVSIETICAVTKISSRYVEALEAGNYAVLPGGVFRKGILRGYLKVLELDETHWIERFEASLNAIGKTEPAIEDWVEFAENVRRSRVSRRPATGMRWLGVAAMFALLTLFAWLVWSMVLHRRLEFGWVDHRVDMQFRAEAFNVFNHNNPASISVSSFNNDAVVTNNTTGVELPPRHRPPSTR